MKKSRNFTRYFTKILLIKKPQNCYLKDYTILRILTQKYLQFTHYPKQSIKTSLFWYASWVSAYLCSIFTKIWLNPSNEAMKLFLSKQCFNGFAIGREINNSREAWGFFGHMEDTNFQKTCLENLESLLAFIQYSNMILQNYITPANGRVASYIDGLDHLSSENLKPKDPFLLELMHSLKDNLSSHKPLLTSAEVKCLILLTSNFSQKEIANSLEISIKTVEAHISNIKAKLKMDRKSQLTAFFNDNYSHIKSLWTALE